MNWINLKEEKPNPCETVLLFDGKEVFVGWLETCNESEDLVFVFYPEIENGRDIDVISWLPISEFIKMGWILWWSLSSRQKM